MKIQINEEVVLKHERNEILFYQKISYFDIPVKTNIALKQKKKHTSNQSGKQL